MISAMLLAVLASALLAQGELTPPPAPPLSPPTPSDVPLLMPLKPKLRAPKTERSKWDQTPYLEGRVGLELGAGLAAAVVGGAVGFALSRPQPLESNPLVLVGAALSMPLGV